MFKYSQEFKTVHNQIIVSEIRINENNKDTFFVYLKPFNYSIVNIDKMTKKEKEIYGCE